MTRRMVMLPATTSDQPLLSVLWNDAGVREWLFDGVAIGPTQARRLLALQGGPNGLRRTRRGGGNDDCVQP